MQMAPDDLKKYPKGTLLIMNLESHVANSIHRNVRDAFLKACKAEPQHQFASNPKGIEKIAQDALHWGKPPQIWVEKRGLVQGTILGQPFEGCGWNDNRGRWPVIRVTRWYFDAFEFGLSDDYDRWANRIRRTVLHEMVHWVRDKAGAEEQAITGPLVVPAGQQPGKRVEPGHWFEEMAYGVGNVCTDAEIKRAILSYQ
jgi:hypothetical protein